MRKFNIILIIYSFPKRFKYLSNILKYLITMRRRTFVRQKIFKGIKSSAGKKELNIDKI